jgi:hypothetical protein
MTRPWENVSPSARLWEAQQPLFNRTVAVHRSKTNAVTTGGSPQVGLTGYSGREQSTASADAEGETVLFTGLPAAIQAKRAGRTKGTLLAADIVDKPEWVILIPASAIAQYAIRDRDIIVDDEQYRYMVASNYWTLVGYQLSCIRLET